MEIIWRADGYKWTDVFFGMCLHSRLGLWGKSVLFGLLLFVVGLHLQRAFKLECTHCRWLFLFDSLMLLFFVVMAGVVLVLGIFAIGSYMHFKASAKMREKDGRMVINDIGIAATSNLGHLQFTWEHFKMWRENKRTIIVCLQPRQLLHFPRRLFQSAEEWETFRSILSKHLKKR